MFKEQLWRNQYHWLFPFFFIATLRIYINGTSSDVSPGNSQMKLPVTIKQLLKLKGLNPPPPPSIPKLDGILRSSMLDAKQKNAETAWLVLTVCHQGITGFIVLWAVSHPKHRLALC